MLPPFFFGRGGNAGNNGWPLADADAMMTSGSASRVHHFFPGTREDGQFSALLCRSVPVFSSSSSEGVGVKFLLHPLVCVVVSGLVRLAVNHCLE